MDEKLLKYKAVIDLTQTTEDVVSLNEEIDLLLQSLYHVEIYDFEDVMSKFVRLRVAMEIKKLVQSSTNLGKDQIKHLLSDMYRKICSLPILRLTLALEPSEFMINNISRWARMNIEEGILIDLSLDRSLCGGAIIVCKGKLYDFSLKKKLKEIFEKGDLAI